MLYTGQLEVVVSRPNNAYEFANPFNSFSGGLTIKGAAGTTFSTSNLNATGGWTSTTLTTVRINNQASGTGTVTLDNGHIWTPSAAAYTLTNPISVTANGGILRSDNNGTYYTGPISSTGGAPLLLLTGTSSRPTMNLNGSMSGFTGTLALDSNNGNINLRAQSQGRR